MAYSRDEARKLAERLAKQAPRPVIETPSELGLIIAALRLYASAK